MKLKFALFLFSTLFYFSCSSFPGIEKRHYRDGFYVPQYSKNKLPASSSDTAFAYVTADLQTGINTNQGLLTAPVIPASGNKSTEKRRVNLAKKNISQLVISVPEIPIKPIELPKEPFNKKAKAAIVFYVLAKIAVLTTFIISLFSVLSTILIFAGIAVLFALLAIIFGLWAQKELAAQPAYEKELGEKQANEVVQRGLAGLGTAVFIVLLALLIEWIRNQ
jgi:hypothetical protein